MVVFTRDDRKGRSPGEDGKQRLIMTVFDKFRPLECGIEPVTGARDRYSIRYYLVAMLFVIFDVETVFMFPWAVIFNKLLLFGFLEMMVFIFILVVGYYYAWQKGALEWV